LVDACQGNAPDARAGSQVQDTDRRTRLGELQHSSQELGGWIAHRENVFDQVDEKLRAAFLLIDFGRGGARLDGLGEFHPTREQLRTDMPEDSALETGLSGDQEGSGFRRQGIPTRGVLGEQANADQAIGEDADSPDGGSGLFGQFVGRLGSLVEGREQSSGDA
jgi:hypothetical protein